ncbi:MAG: class I SAM-dependent methyltransferase [Allosphingosinicella sp.]
MPSSSFLRAVLMGAAAVLAVLLAIAAYRFLTPEPEVRSGNFNPAEFVRSRPKLDAPYVVTDYEVVDAMLAMAEVRPDDFVLDLGSGDGRILIAAARSHGARGLGVEIDPGRIREAEANARGARVNNKVQFRRQDLFETPLNEADVLTLYLTPEVNLRLRPRILSQMRPGSRVVSHDFDMGDWRPEARRQVGSATLYLWVVPAQVAGRWRLDTEDSSATLELQQSHQQLQGTIVGSERSSRVEQGRVLGQRVSFVADPGDGRRAFEGRLNGNRIEPLRPGEGWRAVRVG